MTDNTTEMLVCASCGKRMKALSKRLPKGWKRRAGESLCEGCWHASYRLQALTIPVLKPLEKDWEELRARLHEMWALSTQASNWIMTQLYLRDVQRRSGEKMPRMPNIYLYPEMRALFPKLPPQTCAAMEHAIQRTYRAIRYQVIWTCRQSLPTFRYPVPFPVPKHSWRAEFVADRPVVSVRVGEARIQLQLNGGPHFRRQRRVFEGIVSGSIEAGELALYERGKNVLCKIVVWLPRAAHQNDRTETLLIQTSREAFMIALNSKEEILWQYNGDHLLRIGMAHRKQLRRWSQDERLEFRSTPLFADRRRQATERYHRRMNTACHQIAAIIAGYADRRHFAAVRYDDQIREFCVDFPWAQLRSLIAEKLDAIGIQLELVDGSPSRPGN